MMFGNQGLKDQNEYALQHSNAPSLRKQYITIIISKADLLLSPMLFLMETNA